VTGIDMSVYAAREDGQSKKCPPYLRWTKKDGPSYPCTDGAEGVFCWRCQLVLLEYHAGHEVTLLVRR
jgi:hypothetical protein